MSVHLRTAVDADRDALRVVYRRSSLSNDRDRDVLLAHPDALEFEGAGIDDGRTLVAVDRGEIVGFATLVRSDHRCAELEDLFVDPDHQRQGVGRALMTGLTERARVAGDRCISVTANPDALAFYESVGFVVVGQAETRFGPAPRMSVEIRDQGNASP